MKRVGIDCRFASYIGAGLGTYTRELVSALARIPDRPYQLVLFVQEADEPWLSTVPPYVERVICDIPHYSLKEQLKLPGMIRAANIDLWFNPHFNVPLRCPVPFVCTIHDLILHHYPNKASFLKKKVYHYLLRHALEKACTVLTISEATKNDIKKQYPSVQNIHVIYPGIGSHFVRRAPEEVIKAKELYGISSDYFLYVGNAKQHKNVQMLIDAHAALRDRSTQLVLITAGQEMHALKLHDGVKIISEVPNEQLPALYSGAKACVTATKYEGFGLPVAEGMACHCPVIASDIPPIREVAEEYATLVPITVEDFSKALSKKSHKSPAPPHEWREKFSWQHSAVEVSRVLMGCLGLQGDKQQIEN